MFVASFKQKGKALFSTQGKKGINFNKRAVLSFYPENESGKRFKKELEWTASLRPGFSMGMGGDDNGGIKCGRGASVTAGPAAGGLALLYGPTPTASLIGIRAPFTPKCPGFRRGCEPPQF